MATAPALAGNGMAPVRTRPATRARLQGALWRAEDVLDRCFGAKANPLRQLGALSFYLFWIVAASGIYVYAAYDTSVEGAYASVERISRSAWPLLGAARSLHRYASDAFAVFVLLHLAREWIGGHARGFRWFSWITGVPLLWLLYASGIGGYWLVWDKLAQFSLIATTEWLDALPGLGELARNFAVNAQVNDRLFSLLMFLHIGLPLALLLVMWMHIHRISHAGTQPPRVLAIGVAGMLLVLVALKPVTSDVPADLAAVPTRIAVDWIYQAIHPLQYALSPTAAWLVVGVATLGLALLPWLPPARRAPVARVDLANCNGCGRCQADCPYAAVTLQPRTDGRSAPRQAVVDAELCAACGICSGACPSSTPFRNVAELVTGIDMPQRPLTRVRGELERALARLRGDAPIVVFGCQCGADVARLAAPDTAAVPLLCTGMLPPSFIEYALRSGAAGVLVTGCREGDCAFRLGNRWTEARLAGEREPHLRAGIARSRVNIAWAGSADDDRLAAALARLRASLRTQVLPASSVRPKRQESVDG